MALFNFGKKKEEEKKTPACACSCGCAASEAESITNDCCPDLKEGEICCIKVLGAGCKSCHEQFEYTKQAVKDMGLSVEVEYITDMQKVMEYGATRTSLQTEQCLPAVLPGLVQVASTAGSVTSVWPLAGITSCFTRTSLQTEQCLPSVLPGSMQVGSTAGSVTSV